jgi:hypothetical protein
MSQGLPQKVRRGLESPPIVGLAQIRDIGWVMMADSSAEPYRGHRSRERGSTVASVLRIAVLTLVSIVILAVAVSRLSHDRAGVAAFTAAPGCPAGISTAAANSEHCKLVAAYTVASTSSQGSGQDWKAFISVSSGSSAQRQFQFVSPANQTGFAQAGDTVHLTTWQGIPIYVSNGILTAELVNPLLESGDGPYLWIWYTIAFYVFLVPLLLIRRRLALLMIAPAAALIAGLLLHDSIVGGDWRHCFLYIGVALIALNYLILGVGRLKSVRRLMGRA